MADTPGGVPRERVLLRLVAFGVGLALVFVGAFGIGRFVGPLDQDDPAPAVEQDMDMDHG